MKSSLKDCESASGLIEPSGLSTTGSRTSSRNSSVARSTIPVCDDQVSATCPVDCDHSSADIMHKRLPLGFQHFKRYLDNKFGPDHPFIFTPGEVQTPAELTDPALSAGQNTDATAEHPCHGVQNVRWSNTTAISAPGGYTVSRMTDSTGAMQSITAMSQPRHWANQLTEIGSSEGSYNIPSSHNDIYKCTGWSFFSCISSESLVFQFSRSVVRSVRITLSVHDHSTV